MRIHTATTINGFPTLQAYQVRRMLDEAEAIHGPDTASWAAPAHRFGAVLDLDPTSTVRDACEAIRARLGPVPPSSAAPQWLSIIAAGERYRRRCRLWLTPSAAIYVKRSRA